MPLPVKVTPVVPLIAPDRVRPALSLLAKLPPPVPSVTAFDSAIAVEPVVARVPFASVSAPMDILPAAEIDKVPPPLTVVVNAWPLFVPLSVSVPPATIKPAELVPVIPPANVPLALVRVSALLPSATVPVPVSALMEAPLVVAEMSNVPASATPDEEAIAPEPDSASVPPLMVVAPV